MGGEANDLVVGLMPSLGVSSLDLGRT